MILAGRARLSTYRFLGRGQIADRICEHLDAGRLGPPYLFSGSEGAGKEATALEIARRINCDAPERCHTAELCASCLKAVTFQHPDIRWIGPAPAAIAESAVRELLEQKIANPFYQAPFAVSARIAIGDPEHPGPLSVRSLIQFVRRQSFQGRFKVAIVADAHRLGTAAANALLKTLEEPPPATLIFLLSSDVTALLPTIVSRCLKVSFEPYPAAELVEILTRMTDIDPDEAASLARIADGNARRAVALLTPEARAVQTWSGALFAWIDAGQSGSAQLAADQLHRGVLPDDLLEPEQDARGLDTSDLAAKRRRALLLCEGLNLYYSEAVASRERGGSWIPRIGATAAAAVQATAERRQTRTLLADILRVEATKHEIDGNVNIGLSLAVLFQGLIDNAARDQASVRSG